MLGALDFSRMDRRVTVQSVSRSNNTKGEAIETWSTVRTVAAEAREPTGREVFQSEQRAAQIDRVFVIRWFSGLTKANHRILYEGDVYDIFEVGEIGRQAGMMIRARVHRDDE